MRSQIRILLSLSGDEMTWSSIFQLLMGMKRYPMKLLMMKILKKPFCSTFHEEELNSPLKKLPDESSSPPLINTIDEKENFLPLVSSSHQFSVIGRRLRVFFGVEFGVDKAFGWLFSSLVFWCLSFSP